MSWKMSWHRFLFNLFPAFRGTGGRIVSISEDWREVLVKIPLNWRTRNYVGTIFGGSMYGAVDPIYMLILIKVLGDGYIVWDQSAEIVFQKPGRSTLYANCRVSESEAEEIRERLMTAPSLVRDYRIELVNEQGVVHAIVNKRVFIRRADSRK